MAPAARSPQRQGRLQHRLGMSVNERQRPIGKLDVVLVRELLDLVGDGFGDVPETSLLRH